MTCKSYNCLLPDGTRFESWEKLIDFTRTYYVDCNSQNANDEGPGSREHPFKTIDKAAKVLMPGERAVIAEGVYRECVKPDQGGTGPDKIISYEAAEGAKVVVKGSSVLNEGWEPSSGWKFGKHKGALEENPKIWQNCLDGRLFEGYNPFGMANVLHDRFWLFHKRIKMDPFFQRRGMVFVDGKPLKQVDLYYQLGEGDGRFWIEHNGMTLHVRFPGDDSPDNHVIEITTKEQVFSPAKRHMGYIRVKGITFEHAGNGFPVPQRGLVSSNRGHHWILEDNTIEWANSVGLDLGNECWHASGPEEIGYHIVRNNAIRHCGICGFAAIESQGLLIEDNVIEYCGWHDAEHMYESGGVKFHEAKNLLFRGNVIRHMIHAPGLWLDCSNINCRITGNIFTDIASRAGAIHFEGTHGQNQVDNNIIWGVKAQCSLDGEYGEGGHGIKAEGSDKVIFANNLVACCENAGFYSDTVPHRIIDGRGGTARDHKICSNIFFSCGRSAIELANEQSYTDGNLFCSLPGGFLRMGTPVPSECLDLEAWNEFHGFEKTGSMGSINSEFDAEKLFLKLDFDEGIEKVDCLKSVNTDFYGEEITEDRRYPGPFNKLPVEFYRILF